MPAQVITSPVVQIGVPDLVNSFLIGRSPGTMTAYSRDLEDLRLWAGAASVQALTQSLIEAGPGAANLAVLRYRGELVQRQLSPATVNRRLTAIRSLLTLARTLGLITWGIEIEGVRRVAYRDTRGPGLTAVRRLVRAASEQGSVKAARDGAIIALLAGMALRRAEVVSLDLGHWHSGQGVLAVLGKGQTERLLMTVPVPVRKALDAWVAVRGQDPGPLFISLDPARKGDGRLTGDGLYRSLGSLGSNIGVRVRPHGLRHTAITSALDLCDGNVRKVMKFSRHVSVETVLVYDDARSDVAGAVAEQVAAVALGG